MNSRKLFFSGIAKVTMICLLPILVKLVRNLKIIEGHNYKFRGRDRCLFAASKPSPILTSHSVFNRKHICYLNSAYWRITKVRLVLPFVMQ